MNIETKYSKNDTVYFMEENRIVNGNVTSIFIEVFNEKTEIRYKSNNSKNSYKEEDLFKTKKELLSSL